MPPAVPAAQRLTLAQAVQVGLGKNPLITASEHQVTGARANLSGQRAPANPTLNLTGSSNTSGFFDPSDPTKYGVLFTVETSGRQRLRSHQARAQFQGTQADAETTRLAVRHAVASAYADLQVANQSLENEREAYEVARRLSDLTEKQFQLGAAPETNAIRARIALTQEEQNLLRAISDVRLARASLNTQLGLPPDAPVDAADPLAYAPIQVQRDTLQQQAAQARPEIHSGEASRRALQATVGLQRSLYYPDLVVGGNPRALRDEQVQLGLALPLFDFGSIRGQVRKAQEDVRVQDAQLEQTRQTVRLEVDAAYLDLTRAQQIVASFQDGILPRAGSLLTRIEQGYTLGASTILDLIDAQQTYRSTRRDYYAAIGDHRRALAQLERAVGVPIDSLPTKEVKKP